MSAKTQLYDAFGLQSCACTALNDRVRPPLLISPRLDAILYRFSGVVFTRPYSDLLRIVNMSTQVMAVPVSLDVRMLLPGRRPRIVPSPVCVSRVRRCLFGLPSEPQQAAQQAAEELKRQSQIDSQRWNFDFAHEKPLPGGQFVWHKAQQPEPAETTTTSHHEEQPARMRQAQITGKSCCCSTDVHVSEYIWNVLTYARRFSSKTRGKTRVEGRQRGAGVHPRLSGSLKNVWPPLNSVFPLAPT